MAEPNDANSVYDFLNVSETLLIDVGKNMNNLAEVSRKYSFLNESEQSMLESLNAALASVTKKLERVKGAASDINREEAEKHGLERDGAELIFKLRLFNRIKHKIYLPWVSSRQSLRLLKILLRLVFCGLSTSL